MAEGFKQLQRYMGKRGSDEGNESCFTSIKY